MLREREERLRKQRLRELEREEEEAPRQDEELEGVSEGKVGSRKKSRCKYTNQCSNPYLSRTHTCICTSSIRAFSSTLFANPSSARSS